MVKTCDSTFVSLNDVSLGKKNSHKCCQPWWTNTKQMYVLSIFRRCQFITISFDLWMFKGDHDIFANIINLSKTKLVT
jgi:hypothetical protein